MDITIQMKSLDLLTKFLKHDLRNVPSYGYSLQKPRMFGLPPERKPLPRTTPEAMGVSSRDVERLFKLFSRDEHDVAAHGLIVMRHGYVIAEGYWAPYTGELPHMLFSMSKTITATAIGIAVDEGILSLDEKLIDIFPEEAVITGLALPKFLREHRVKHLLTMSSGVRFNEVGSMLDDAWVKMFMQSMPKFEAGTAFEYNSINTYMLAAIIKKKTGLSLTDYLKPRLYEPLGIDLYPWETCPQGIEKGGWGLSLRLEDSAKLGQLYLDRGVYEGKRIFSEAWAYSATTKQIETPNGESQDGYGLQIWMDGMSTGAYSFRGVFGQYVMVLPELDMVVATYGGSPYVFAKTEIQRYVTETMHFLEPVPLPKNDVAYASLESTIRDLHVVITPRRLLFDTPLFHDASELERIVQKLGGAEYRLESNNCGLFPMSIQGIHGNYTMGTDVVRFEADGAGGLDMVFYEYNERNRVHISPTEKYTYFELASRSEYHRVAAEATWKLTADGIYMCVILHFLETPFARIIHIAVKNSKLSLAYDESPIVEESAGLLLDLLGISRMALMRSLLSLGRKENIQSIVKRMTAPQTEGTLINKNDVPLVE